MGRRPIPVTEEDVVAALRDLEARHPDQAPTYQQLQRHVRPPIGPTQLRKRLRAWGCQAGREYEDFLARHGGQSQRPSSIPSYRTWAEFFRAEQEKRLEREELARAIADELESRKHE